MRLNRTLFYIMLGVFIAGVLMAVFIKPENVAMSRIATGLITGSFIGLVSSIVNYVYAWQKFMTEILAIPARLTCWHIMMLNLMESRLKIAG